MILSASIDTDSSAARILKAAKELFARFPPDEVTVADVAAEAGVSRGTVFNQYGSKRGLLEAITEEVLASYAVMLDEALAERRRSVPDLLRDLFTSMGLGIENNRSFHRAVFREIAKLNVGLDESGPEERARQAGRERIEHLLERGQARGEIVADHKAQDLASAIDSLVFGTITHWLYDDDNESLRARMARAAEIFLGPVATAVAPRTKRPRTRAPRGERR